MKNRYLPIVGIALLVVIAASSVYVLNANSGKHSTASANTTQSRLKVLATFFPVYDFARNVGGDRVDVSILVPETVDVHQFEPNPSTVQEVAVANVLIFSGAGLEPWYHS